MARYRWPGKITPPRFRSKLANFFVRGGMRALHRIKKARLSGIMLGQRAFFRAELCGQIRTQQ